MSWIRRNDERKRSESQAQNGPGTMIRNSITESDGELLGKGRLFSENILKKDCGVGYHVHEGDAEIYLILSGEAEYSDNGTITALHPGDVTFTGPGEGHSITNRGDEPVYFIALILYE
jgi:mannose-6-phosphate isomerase-like protein (cupin superfamily)